MGKKEEVKKKVRTFIPHSRRDIVRVQDRERRQSCSDSLTFVKQLGPFISCREKTGLPLVCLSRYNGCSMNMYPGLQATAEK